jgi:hypothetical protein
MLAFSPAHHTPLYLFVYENWLYHPFLYGFKAVKDDLSNKIGYAFQYLLLSKANAMPQKKNITDKTKLDEIVAEARRNQTLREQSYRGQALKMFPWICGRCAREFSHKNLPELTVHHKNHDHDFNPADGSNWELLCLYCHDNEHQRYEETRYGISSQTAKASAPEAKHNPFANLKSLLASKK